MTAAISNISDSSNARSKDHSNWQQQSAAVMAAAMTAALSLSMVLAMTLLLVFSILIFSL